MAPKVCTAEEAAGLVSSGDTITVSGVIRSMLPAKILDALEMRFLSENEPRDLTWFDPFPTGVPGVEPLSHVGMLKRVIGGWYSAHPNLRDMIVANQVEAYLYPLGTLGFICQQIAAGRKGFLTQTGLETYIDPRIGGARLNDVTTEELVSVVDIDQDEYLWYKAFPITVAILRGTTVDEEGNLSLEEEAVTMNILNQALAAKACGGTVIVQAQRIVKAGAIPARMVAVPGILVDAIVLDPDQYDNPDSSLAGWMRPTVRLPRPPKEVLISPDPDTWTHWALERRIDDAALETLPLVPDTIVARRALLEMYPGIDINLGAGLPLRAIVPACVEEDIDQRCNLTSEGGQLGGDFSGGHFAAYRSNTRAILDTPSIFSYYSAGLIQTTFLGMLQFDRDGNVNVLRLGDTIVGPGGSMDIAVAAQQIVFCGTMKVVGLETAVQDGRLQITHEGAIPRGVEQVEAICFNGRKMLREGRDVLYVTERAVFRLTIEGPMLIEVAPGIDIERDVLAQMDFRPPLAREVKIMDPRIFQPRAMGLRADWDNWPPQASAADPVEVAASPA